MQKLKQLWKLKLKFLWIILLVLFVVGSVVTFGVQSLFANSDEQIWANCLDTFIGYDNTTDENRSGSGWIDIWASAGSVLKDGTPYEGKLNIAVFEGEIPSSTVNGPRGVPNDHFSYFVGYATGQLNLDNGREIKMHALNLNCGQDPNTTATPEDTATPLSTNTPIPTSTSIAVCDRAFAVWNDIDHRTVVVTTTSSLPLKCLAGLLVYNMNGGGSVNEQDQTPLGEPVWAIVGPGATSVVLQMGQDFNPHCVDFQMDVVFDEENAQKELLFPDPLTASNQGYQYAHLMMHAEHGGGSLSVKGDGVGCEDETPTPENTATHTPTASSTPTPTGTNPPTVTPTETKESTPTPSNTPSPTVTPTKEEPTATNQPTTTSTATSTPQVVGCEYVRYSIDVDAGVVSGEVKGFGSGWKIYYQGSSNPLVSQLLPVTNFVIPLSYGPHTIHFFDSDAVEAGYICPFEPQRNNLPVVVKNYAKPTPIPTSTPVVLCPVEFGFSTDGMQPTIWYQGGVPNIAYPTQRPGVDLWLKFREPTSGYYIIQHGSFHSMKGQTDNLPETYVGVLGRPWLFLWQQDNPSGSYEFDITYRANGQDRVLCEVDIKIDDGGPPTE